MLLFILGASIILIVTGTESQCRIDCYRSNFYEIIWNHSISNEVEHNLLNSTLKTLSDESSFEVLIAPYKVYPEMRFVESCKLGCSLFFSSSVVPMTLSHCFNSCGRTYFYNSSINDNDRAAIYQCMKGCWQAMNQCQPGYFCVHNGTIDGSISIPKSIEINEWMNVSGSMFPCPRGTYRTIDSTSVTACEPCPPGRYRNDIKGTSIESCSKCPPNTFANQSGSSSISNCIPCPLGTFAQESGSSACKCITPASCEVGKKYST